MHTGIHLGRGGGGERELIDRFIYHTMYAFLIIMWKIQKTFGSYQMDFP